MKTLVTNSAHAVDKVWLEAYVLTGSNVYEACREVAEIANNLKMRMCAELNGTWVHILPGNDPDAEVEKFSKVFNARKTA